MTHKGRIVQTVMMIWFRTPEFVSCLHSLSIFFVMMLEVRSVRLRGLVRRYQIGADNQFGKDFNHPDPTTQGTIVRVIYVLHCGACAHCVLLRLRSMYVEGTRRSGRRYLHDLSIGHRMRRRKSNDVLLGRKYWEKTHDHVWCDYNVGWNGENCSFPCSYAFLID